MHNNLLVFLYILNCDRIDNLLLCEHLLIETELYYDQTLFHSSLLSYGTFHNLLDMPVLYDLLLYYNLFDDKTYNHLLILLSFQYGSLNTAMADVRLIT